MRKNLEFQPKFKSHQNSLWFCNFHLKVTKKNPTENKSFKIWLEKMKWNISYLFSWYILIGVAKLIFLLQVLRANYDRTKFSIFFSTNFWNSNFHCHIWIVHEKCVILSTNKPSIGAVVLEIALWIFWKWFQIAIFQINPQPGCKALIAAAGGGGGGWILNGTALCYVLSLHIYGDFCFIYWAMICIFI